MATRILLFGATGDTGSALLDQALDAGHHVRAAERDFPDDFKSHPNLETREANLLDAGLADLMDGIDTVISAVGVPRDPQTLINPPPLYSEGAVNMITGMRKAKVKRLVTISAAFVDPDATVPMWFKAATAPLDRIFRQMGEMERVLRVCEDIDWTAVRPGWLLNRERTGDFEVSLDDLPDGTLRTRRPDLAQFMLDCATQEKHVRERPFIARKESAALESPPALIEEFFPF
jgi:putative NADH-flavin reductase